MAKGGACRMKPEDKPLAGIPWVAIGNDQLGCALGSTYVCPHCHKKHVVEHSGSMDWVKCPKSGRCYMIGMDGCEITK